MLFIKVCFMCTLHAYREAHGSFLLLKSDHFLPHGANSAVLLFYKSVSLCFKGKFIVCRQFQTVFENKCQKISSFRS